MSDPMKSIAEAERALAAAREAVANAQRQHAQAVSDAAANLADLHRQLAAERTPQDGPKVQVSWDPAMDSGKLLETLRRTIKAQHRGDFETAIGPDTSNWTLTDLLLARIEQHLADANWQRGGRQGQRPVRSGEDIAARLRRLGLIPNPDDDDPTAVGVTA